MSAAGNDAVLVRFGLGRFALPWRDRTQVRSQVLPPAARDQSSRLALHSIDETLAPPKSFYLRHEISPGRFALHSIDETPAPPKSFYLRHELSPGRFALHSIDETPAPPKSFHLRHEISP